MKSLLKIWLECNAVSLLGVCTIIVFNLAWLQGDFSFSPRIFAFWFCAAFIGEFFISLAAVALWDFFRDFNEF